MIQQTIIISIISTIIIPPHNLSWHLTSELDIPSKGMILSKKEKNHQEKFVDYFTKFSVTRSPFQPIPLKIVDFFKNCLRGIVMNDKLIHFNFQILLLLLLSLMFYFRGWIY